MVVESGKFGLKILIVIKTVLFFSNTYLSVKNQRHQLLIYILKKTNKKNDKIP